MKKVNITANGLTFDCWIQGEENTQIPMLFLHGWPETGIMWEKVLDAFAKEGHYCVAPYMRGFSPSARPKKKKNYHIDHLTQDIYEIAQTLQWEKFHLVGHDWGAIIAWVFAARHPEKLHTLTAISCPHPQAFGLAIENDPEQQEMSDYARKFQIPILPEWILRRNDFAILKEIWKDSPKEHIDDYLNIFGGKNALTSTLHYYRANFKELKKNVIDLNAIDTPSLMIWGKNDQAIGRFGIENTEKYVNSFYQLKILDGGHFLIAEMPSTIIELTKKHIQKNHQ